MGPLVHQRKIAFGDTDAAGIVYTPRFAHFCMEAAEYWFRDVINFDWYYINTELGLGTPVVHMEIDFLGPLKAGDQLAVTVLVAAFSRSTISLSFVGTKDDPNAGRVFTGKIIFCCTAAGRGAIPIPDTQRRLIEEYMAASDAVVS